MTAAWIIAYLVAGAGFVAKDQSEPVYNQKGYVQSKSGRWLVRLLWPLVSIQHLWALARLSGKYVHEFIGGQLLPTVVLFIAVGAVGSWLGGLIF